MPTHKSMCQGLRGTASFKHLVKAPCSDVMSREVADAISNGNNIESLDAIPESSTSSVESDHHNRMMNYLSTATGR